MNNNVLPLSSAVKVTRKSKKEFCASCGQKKLYVSQNGNCQECVKAKVLEANTQMKLRRGPIWEKYKRKLALRLGLVSE